MGRNDFHITPNGDMAPGLGRDQPPAEPFDNALWSLRRLYRQQGEDVATLREMVAEKDRSFVAAVRDADVRLARELVALYELAALEEAPPKVTEGIAAAIDRIHSMYALNY